ncbi:MAG: hypothetical protein A2538_04945 [Candidatus Magasanikbacteria bacterium RIFOXYD2_FULL_41_14]|uniref:UDP-N-acetylglucosamine--N-acetylmuramyl-(pentapeptide) pyrophosphoryl-undecaprenol N-acetylglucosamine transferase n=1 Tax=Candidatus Magasanikbacteria bacterium RIFOXYD2_FULL_41_14 TaxID=1798709 RepID=A0A1F6PGF2_9BACT|nr:MAG: hypothetical protein A2538_04945 [Candidatus Magasanikbacteria bacterium RIFOXYD2_FULL_41_14]
MATGFPHTPGMTQLIMKIILSGGGTLGPVVPLLVIAEMYRKYNPAVQFIWVGTKNGPEKEMVAKHGILFYSLTAGKWRRYFSFWNFIDIFKIFVSFFSSLILLRQEKPDLLISGGGFVSVPLHWVGWLLGIPCWIHQQDVLPGLANQLMSRTATKITTALKESATAFSRKSEWIGNPVRDLTVNDLSAARARFDIPAGVPVIFAMGGGTGSMTINKLIIEAMQSWPKEWHVIHLTGKERPAELNERATGVFPNYRVYKFFVDEMKDAYALADVAVGRAGFATITELASLSKAAILIPMRGTHQEANVKKLVDEEAVLVLNEDHESGLKLAQMVRELVEDDEERARLGKKLNDILPRANARRIVAIINELLI